MQFKATAQLSFGISLQGRRAKGAFPSLTLMFPIQSEVCRHPAEGLLPLGRSFVIFTTILKLPDNGTGRGYLWCIRFGNRLRFSEILAIKI